MSRRAGARCAAVVSVALALAGCGGGGKTAATSSSAKSCGTGKAASIRPLERGETARVVVTTNKGAFTIALDTRDSPCATASFVALARKGFFDKTVFHRIVPGFVIQGGDPTGKGTGGPGYQTVDPPPASARYTRGVVAMAKTQTDPPGAAGSQFFVVTGQDVGLPPDYALLGKVVAGAATVARIGKLGDPATEQPTQKVEITGMTVNP